MQKSMRSVVAALLLGTATVASAADTSYPNKPITLVVAFSPGGVVDSIARIVGERLASKYGQPVVVENRSGAGGAIGTAQVASSAADGYTLLTVSTYFAVLPSVMKNVTWSPTKDFTAIANVGMIPNVIVVNPKNPVNSFQELLDKAKSGAPLTYSSPGVGTSNHLTGELLSQLTKTDMVHVPYKGQSDALSDLLAGRVDMMALTSALAGQYVKSGKLKALAVATNVRSSALPSVPTVEEASDIKDFDVRSWFGFVAPAQTPSPVVEQLAKDIEQILTEKDVMEKLAGLGLQKDYMGPKAYQSYISEEQARWKKVVDDRGISQKNQ
ncbi:Bug family tripartite tricarboxylate transporter substrate binding protein [Achromobacter animicus]|uniref:Bug family tripartite tricarboxylate transporter substrate binding protein n=1 Tax=Achromobacter animicus TaxID=1389935 RepID=UPI0024472DC3|nr:tripartite tricarboxylate transporter substrate binding protein [Achromobacter animicus]MDH0683063.1 tripartite tricarboxylate transporter substrate binding protein [Achromobacter animicus]